MVLTQSNYLKIFFHKTLLSNNSINYPNVIEIVEYNFEQLVVTRASVNVYMCISIMIYINKDWF